VDKNTTDAKTSASARHVMQRGKISRENTAIQTVITPVVCQIQLLKSSVFCIIAECRVGK
jgi:hypothetical protein